MPFQLPGYLPSNILPSVVWHGLVWLGSDTFIKVGVSVFLPVYIYAINFISCINVVYGDLHYLGAVHKEAECSMDSSVAEVQALPHYTQQGEVSLRCHLELIDLSLHFTSISVGHH